MDEKFMLRALELASKGRGKVSPNPLVGAVVVRDDRVIGEGWHAVYGGPHAEAAAIEASGDVQNSTVYVNLEPCSHHGKTPPCAELLIARGVSRVVVGTLDPNPKVAGRGVEALRKAGIQVDVGILDRQCRRLNEAFFWFITQKTPWLVLKTAMTLDGKITGPQGETCRITSDESIREVHKLRHAMDAVMTGIGTVLADDPRLTCRMESGVHPHRVIIDSSLRIPLSARVLEPQNGVRIIIATGGLSPVEKEKKTELQQKGIEVLEIGNGCGQVDLVRLMDWLGKESIGSVLLEAGSGLNSGALQVGIVHKLVWFLAPKIMGGMQAASPVGGQGFLPGTRGLGVSQWSIEPSGPDMKIEGYLEGEC